MTDADPIIERIKKLLALAERNTFPEEAQAARAKAEKLMAQHNITEDQLSPPSELQQLRTIFANTTTCARQPSVIDLSEFMKRSAENLPQGVTANFSHVWVNGVRVQ
jgi:hypothetical protein